MSEELKDARKRLIEEQILGQQADNRMAVALALTAEMAAQREVLRHQWDAAQPSLHRILHFGQPISTNSTESVIDTLSRWDRIDAAAGIQGNEYKIVLCSPGGEVTSGFQGYSFLRRMAQKRPLKIVATGVCASMATIWHQAASPGLRIVEPGCTYLVHELSAGVGGRLDNIEDHTAYLTQLNATMRAIYADRSGGKITDEELKERVTRREKYLFPEEVVEWGLADEVAFG